MTTKRKPSTRSDNREAVRFWVAVAVAVSWFVTAIAASTRIYFLMNYGVAEAVDPFLEPFAATGFATLFCVSVAAVWIALHWRRVRVGNSEGQSADDAAAWRSITFLACGAVPLLLWIARAAGLIASGAQLWEVLWIAAWTGQSFGALVRDADWSDAQDERVDLWLKFTFGLLMLLCGTWWFAQSVEYHRNFMLGFNDFGHFLQRVANTASGRGLLMETPVLPPFWDHFNPGLLLLVPLWMLYPHVESVFALQAGALTLCAMPIFEIARRLGCSRLAAILFGGAWLMQPATGQMNLAYTYGWHPITFAIPLLLGAIWALMCGRKWTALACTLLAMSMEEGVFVIVALVAATCATLPFVERFLSSNADTQQSDKQLAERHASEVELRNSLPVFVWWIVAAASAVAFMLVYRFSGIAEFQTGRFVALGSSVGEILLAPVLRPNVFWGQVLRWDHVIFLLLLLLPCGLPALLRGWRYVLPTLLPLAVLIVWDHRPAHSLAFQYPSILQPFFWLACLTGAIAARRKGTSATGDTLASATTAIATALVLSLFVGQMPFSAATLREVDATTYMIDSPFRRRSDSEDGRWLLAQVSKIRESGATCLATGRVAAHLVGCSDIETVGQYKERRERLAALPDRNGDPIRHYEWLILDRQESFQQTSEQIAEVENEARSSGFVVAHERYGIVLLRRP